jgi:predicted ATP-grasp superfamily ATP-dependent carboligase
MSPSTRQAKGQGRILVTDAHWNKTVAAIRSLGRRGFSVTAGESTWIAAGFFSRHVSHRIQYPSPLVQPDAFVKAIVTELHKKQYDVLMPMELSTLLLLSANRDQFEHLVRFPFAAHDSLLRAAGKKETLQAAHKIGVPMPKTVVVTPGISSASLLNDPGLPMVLKPDFGEGGRGLFYIRNKEELEKGLHEIFKQDKVYLAQEMIPAGGDALGVSLLMDEDGKTLARFTHRRLREYPVSGGPSTLRESCRHEEAEAYAEKLLHALKFQGVAMVEFKVDPRDNVPKLMEINPRFWGSLPLAIAAGVDFPYIVYCWAMKKAFAIPAQKENVRLRNLLPGDLLYLLAKKGKVGRSFFDFTKTSDELFTLDDPGPVLGRLLSPIAFLYDPQLRSILKARQDPKAEN